MRAESNYKCLLCWWTLRESFVPRHVHCVRLLCRWLWREIMSLFSQYTDTIVFFPSVKIKSLFFSAFFSNAFQNFNFLLRKYYAYIQDFFSRIAWIRIRSEIQQSQPWRQLYNIRIYIYYEAFRNFRPFRLQSTFWWSKCQKIFVSVVVCSFPI